MIRVIHRPLAALAVLLLSLTLAACSDDATTTPPSATATATTAGQIETQMVASPTVIETPGTLPNSEAGSPTATTSPTSAPTVTTTPTPLALATPRPVEQSEPPVRLQIPALGIDTAIQWVGLDDSGSMGVPSNATDVAWYERGPSPGTPGNAVIAGHLDSTTGPAIFYDLDELQPGDEIVTTTASGHEYHFVVTSSEVYTTADAPLERIFGTSVLPHLNLITCDGTFDRSIRQYDQRLVVYSELVSGP